MSTWGKMDGSYSDTESCRLRFKEHRCKYTDKCRMNEAHTCKISNIFAAISAMAMQTLHRAEKLFKVMLFPSAPESHTPKDGKQHMSKTTNQCIDDMYPLHPRFDPYWTSSQHLRTLPVTLPKRFSISSMGSACHSLGRVCWEKMPLTVAQRSDSPIAQERRGSKKRKLLARGKAFFESFGVERPECFLQQRGLELFEIAELVDLSQHQAYGQYTSVTACILSIVWSQFCGGFLFCCSAFR